MESEIRHYLKLRRVIAVCAAGLAGVWFLIFLIGNFMNVWQTGKIRAATIGAEPDETGREEFQKKFDRGMKRIKQAAPKGIFVTIDTGRNRLMIMKGEAVLREAVISCGSGNLLEDTHSKRSWVFDTPRGIFSVKSKMRKPSWVKPDWAFIEEGIPVPSDPRARIETGYLGDYAIGFGNGYFIHGTLYTRLLGRSVTHGCIRVGDDDLKVLFNSVEMGTQIFIY